MKRAAVVMLILVAFTAAVAGLAERPDQSPDRGSRYVFEVVGDFLAPRDIKPTIATIEVELEAGAHDRELQARRAGAIFVGTVQGIDRVDRRYGTYDAWTVFDVEVEEVVKGDVAGTLQIIQWGGYYARLFFWLFVSGDPLLHVDETYLFLASSSASGEPEDEGLWFIPHYIGHTRIANADARERLIQQYTAYVTAVR